MFSILLIIRHMQLQMRPYNTFIYSKERKIKAIQQNGIIRASKITGYFISAQSQSTAKIRNIFNSADYWIYAASNEAL